ncbi:pheST operon leader peptide PheM [Candidatus Sodalis endolongispinus]|uniref:pheST attenuator peptide n=1 Tax=Candidatus Sodalis endolongispinus TaxID=2812662 RepID=A0ABS5YDI7_9GAMM|nr:pheST operon leader peptide PheM [Candidatus Sodalis endolongispinus]MBT9433105.1 pheST operon leader peptide PheM [Candidatus Sodalis endolongispinus]
MNAAIFRFFFYFSTCLPGACA